MADHFLVSGRSGSLGCKTLADEVNETTYFHNQLKCGL